MMNLRFYPRRIEVPTVLPYLSAAIKVEIGRVYLRLLVREERGGMEGIDAVRTLLCSLSMTLSNHVH
jgi:hypothetical protein